MANENDKAAPQTFEEWWAEPLSLTEEWKTLPSSLRGQFGIPAEKAPILDVESARLGWNAALRTRPAPSIDEDSAVAVLQRIVNRNWSCPCKGHGSYEAALVCYVTSELQSRPQPAGPSLDDAMVERIAKRVLHVADFTHQGLEGRVLQERGEARRLERAVQSIREALKGGAS